MRIRKYDVDYGRRALLQKAALGAGAGVLAPLWPMIASGDMSKAYPDELTSVEMYTKGKVKTGDVLTAAPSGDDAGTAVAITVAPCARWRQHRGAGPSPASAAGR